MRAVRFETGLIELELSNRIQCKTQPGGSRSYLKLFGKCQVDLNLALGQIVKHQVRQVTAASIPRPYWQPFSYFLCPSRCTKKPGQTSTRWRTSGPGSVCETPCRRK